MEKAHITNLVDGNKRTLLLKKNIISSFAIKGWNCIVQLLLVPITLNCLTQYEYGIWLTINSILVWMDSFDVGLGNGLRNQLTKSLAKNDYKRGQIQVSTTFVMLNIIIIPILALLMSIIYYGNCYAFFNVDPELVPNFKGILMITAAIVGATFVFKFIGNIYLALQLPAINNLIIAIGQTIALILIFLKSLLCTDNSLGSVAIIYATSPLITYICLYPITFTKYKFLKPSIKLFDIKELSPLFGLGIKFFFIQISGMIVFTTSNILISQLFSPKDVAPYQIANRYFGLTNILFTLISSPLWSATTDAYTKGDWKWINNIMKKMRLALMTFFIALIIMLVIANPIYHIWVGDKIDISNTLSISMASYMFVILYGTCYSNMLCGFGKVRLLTYVSLFQAIIFIPLAVHLGNRFNVEGIVFALIATSAISAITNKFQFEMIVSNKARGLLNK